LYSFVLHCCCCVALDMVDFDINMKFVFFILLTLLFILP